MPPRGRSDDIGWQHSRMLEGKRHWFQCNYCNMEFHGGGVSCLKKHLAGVKGVRYSELICCPSVSYDVKIAMAQHLRQSMVKKRTHSQTMLQDDEEGSQDEHRLPSQTTNVHVTIRDPFEKDMQRALRESRAEAWSKGPRWQLGRVVAKFWHHSGLAFNAANSPYYKSMVQEIQNFGKHVQPPTPKELASVYLDAKVEQLKIYIASFKKKWQKNGITIMCDGWSSSTKSSLINFLVYCNRQVFYHKFVDASNHIHNHQYILQLMEQMVAEISEEYVVQVVTDNNSNYKKAREKLMKSHPQIFWTPYAAHYVKHVAEAAQNITQYIYNHTLVLRWMGDFYGGEILRPTITRFATNYIVLDSLFKHRDGLKQMFRSEQWPSSHFATLCDGQEVEGLVNNSNFWLRVSKIVLRLVDGDRTLTMGLVYAKLEAAKKRILATSAKYVHMFINIIKDRWDRQMSRNLHMAAYYLHPGFQHEDEIAYRDDLLGAITSGLKYFREGIGSFGDPSVIAS
ncbi:hypothetical protein Taro_004512 [Colocasia esculenta]|uniref:BED-type domain-containing protein n=1 Tax=Colocasia esculenta TaxID=4460 RepID=A0A843TM70_COLES|nr:hypothetical protein [Colocasia esculenta]